MREKLPGEKKVQVSDTTQRHQGTAAGDKKE